MLNWLRNLFTPEPPPAPAPLGELDELLAEAEELGRQIDALREQRKALQRRAAVLRDGGA